MWGLLLRPSPWSMHRPTTLSHTISPISSRPTHLSSMGTNNWIPITDMSILSHNHHHSVHPGLTWPQRISSWEARTTTQHKSCRLQLRFHKPSSMTLQAQPLLKMAITIISFLASTAS